MSFFNSGKKGPSLLKSYIDAQFLLLRLEKLENQGSTRVLNASEAKELRECVAKYSEIQKGVLDVSEKENAALVVRVRNLLEEVKDNEFTKKQEAAQAVEANMPKNILRREAWRAAVIEKARRADVEKQRVEAELALEKARRAELQNPRQVQAPTARRAEPEKVETLDVEWSRWWDPDSGKEYFSKKGTNDKTWDPPPEGETWEYGNNESRANPQPDIPAGQKIRDVRDTSVERALQTPSSPWSNLNAIFVHEPSMLQPQEESSRLHFV